MRVNFINPIGQIAFQIIAMSNGLQEPSFKGTLVATEGDNIEHIEEITVDEVPQGKSVYYDDGSQRHFVAPSEDFEGEEIQ